MAFFNDYPNSPQVPIYPNEILDKILTVDTDTSGLNATTLKSITLGQTGSGYIPYVQANSTLLIGTSSLPNDGVGSAGYFMQSSVPILNKSGILVVGSSNAAGVDLGGSLGFTANTTTLSNYPMGNISGRLVATGAGVYGAYMAFAVTNNGGSVAEKMRIVGESGSVLIGKTSGTNILEVRKTDNTVYSEANVWNSVGTSNLAFSNQSTTVGAYSSLTFGMGVNSNSFTYISGVQEVNNSLAYLVFGTGGLGTTTSKERMRITSGGSVLIGTTSEQGKFVVSGPNAKTSTTTNSLAFFGSPESSNPWGLEVYSVGGALIANRYVSIRSIEPGIGAGGSISLQNLSGPVLIGTLTVRGTADSKFQIANGDTASSLTVLLGNLAGTTHTNAIIYMNSSTTRNWAVGQNYVTSDRYEIVPSTANGGTTFTTPAFSIVGSTGVVNIANLAGAGSRAVNADASGNLSASSDSSLKKEVVEAPIPGLEEILQLTPRAYKWLSDIELRGNKATTEIGFFANEVAPIIPSAAPLGNDGLYGFYDRSVTATLVKAIQQQNEIINSLEYRLSVLESK